MKVLRLPMKKICLQGIVCCLIIKENKDTCIKTNPTNFNTIVLS